MREKFLGIVIITLFLAETMFIFPTANFSEIQEGEESVLPEHEFIPNDVNKLLLNTPRVFTANHGQLENNEVRFYVQGGGLWFTDDGVWFEVREYTELRGRGSEARGQGGVSGLDFDSVGRFRELEPVDYRRVILKQEFVGANRVRPIGRKRASWDSNFFYGNDSSKWCAEVPNYREVFYENIYQGIDLRYYTNKDGLKYDFIVHPGAKVEQIKIKYAGIEGLEIDHLGNLIIKTSIENLVESGLFIYQNNEDSLHHVNGQFKIYNDFIYGFELLDDYDKSKALVIDPHLALKYSTFIGALGDDYTFGIAVDPNGYAIVNGYTTSPDFPNTTGAFDQKLDGSYDIFILKLDSNGSALIYSTFIGGSDQDSSWSIVLDSNGSAAITGWTGSSDFPTTPGAYDRIFNSTPNAGDSFVLKLNQNGSALIFSTFLGGSQGEWGESIDIDLNGNLYVGGHTGSPDFPNTTGAFEQTFSGTGGNGDSFLVKFNHNCSKLIYSTFIGGSVDDYIREIVVDFQGCVFADGQTSSSDFPITPGAFNSIHSSGFVLKLNSAGSDLIYSTFIGGSTGFDSVCDIAIDTEGFAYIVGNALSADFPTTPGAYDTSFNGGIYDVFVAKLNQNGSALNYSTFIGGTGWDLYTGISIDADCNAIITGFTRSTDFPITSDAYQKNHRGGLYDAFIARLNANGSKLLYSTYFGGKGREDGHYSDFDSKNNVYMTGTTNSTDFPTTPGAFDETYNGNVDGFVLKFSLPPILNIKSISLLKNNESANITYSKLCQYTFQVKVTDNPDLAELRTLRLALDPVGSNIRLTWNRITNKFSKLNDPNNFITLEPSSRAYNNSVTEWIIDFNVTFNWIYPDEMVHNVQAYATSNTLTPMWHNITKFYRVENDLVFNGTLLVKDEGNGTILNDELVRGGESLNWTNLTVVYENTTDIYPPADEFDIIIWDEDGNYFVGSPSTGEPFSIEIITPNQSKHRYNYTINLTGIPQECDKTYQTFTLRIDGDNVTFSNPIPNKNIWHTIADVEIGINIMDIGGGLVNGSSVKYCISNDNGTNWSEWIGFPKLISEVNVNPKDIIFLPDGRDNLVKWQAKDSVGNGPTESEEYRIFVDTEYVIFSNGYPTEKHESLTENVQVGVTISDMTSGVDISTVEYAISINSGLSWKSWKRVTGLNSGNNVNVTLSLKFPNGTGNRIKWRALDVAGNGPKVSKIYVIIVNTWLMEWSIPKVKLWNPSNGSIISSIPLELTWQLLNTELPNVYYDIYLATEYPPIKINQSGIIKTTVIIDNLSNGETYYWTVIPRTAKINGTCESGVWSFTVNIPIPKVNLISPENNSVINDFQPSLSWAVEYDGTEILSYNIYFGTSKDPGLEFKNHPSTICFIRERLTTGETYYWKVEPWAGDYSGPVSETWSFTVKEEYIPHFELELFVSPPVIELPPGDIKRVRAIVKNLGELEDSILLRVEVPSDLGVGAIVDEPCIIRAIPNANAEFYITVTTSMEPLKDEINLIVIASSRRAAEYELTVEEKAELTVKILSQEKKDEDEPWLSLSEFWIIFLIIIIILIVLIIVWTFLRHKKSSQETQEESTAEDSLTVKPGTVPETVISVGEVIPTITPPQLAEATGDAESGQQIQAPVKVPTLAASTTPGQVPETQQIPSTAEVPQLPAAEPETTAPLTSEPIIESSVQASQTEIKEQPPRTTQMQPKEQPNIED